MQTTATYDSQSRNFILDSPTISSTKFFVPNSSKYGNCCVVFANLVIFGKSYGTHAFFVMLRDEKTGSLCLGIQFGDLRDKFDNSWIQFHNAKIPRENLLNRFYNVRDNGDYIKKLEKKDGKAWEKILTQLSALNSLHYFGSCASLYQSLRITCNFLKQSPPLLKAKPTNGEFFAV